MFLKKIVKISKCSPVVGIEAGKSLTKQLRLRKRGLFGGKKLATLFKSIVFLTIKTNLA